MYQIDCSPIEQNNEVENQSIFTASKMKQEWKIWNI